MQIQEIITIAILIIAVISFLAEKIPTNLTVMLTLSALVLTKIVTPQEAVAGFANTTIYMLIGVVIVGGALFETGVCDEIASIATKYAKSERAMIMSILIMSTVMSAVLSNSGTVAVFIPIIMGVCAETTYSRSKLLMSAFLGAMSGGRLTLVGDAAINVLVGNQIAELGTPFGFFEISKIGIPLTLIMFVFMFFIGYRLLPDVKLPLDQEAFQKENHDNVPKWKKVASVAVLLIMVVGMILSDYTGISSYIVAITCAVLDCCLGLFTEKKVYSLVSVKTVILLGGMAPLATALRNTGAADDIAGLLLRVIGNSTNVYFITGMIFILTAVMTQFMSNVVTVTLLMPIIISIATSIGCDPCAMLVVCMVASTLSILTPIACPPANLIYSYGGYRFSDYAKSNILLMVVFLIASIIVIPLIWPIYG